jgi:glycerol uptake facilitator-like aquaporin
VTPDVVRRLAAEGAGTLVLVAAVIGSGIMAERLAGGNAAVALLGNTLATGAMLAVLILVLGPVSGAHFNPVVTLVFVRRRGLAPALGAAYALAQIAGGLMGAALAHAMFELPLWQAGVQTRGGAGQWLGEAVATACLVATILGSMKFRPAATPYAVALCIAGGYWFTSSTSFANPAVTLARGLTATFAGIAPADVPGFVLVQFAAALLAAWGWQWLAGSAPAPTRDPGAA